MGRAKFHGDCNTRLYYIWQDMLNRCRNKNNHNYHNYGGRGIEVCDEWKSYINFKEWAISNGYENNLTLDRVNTNGNYCPENCKWSTIQEQENNRRNNHLITAFNKTQTLSQWSRESGIKITTLRARLMRGIKPEIALTDNLYRRK